MHNSMSYCGIITKVKAMKPKLINSDEYNIIASLESVSDFIAFLKKHSGYKEMFDKYDEHEIHRGEAEKIFINGLYLDYTKIYRFANQEQRRYLEFIFFRYEVNVLKDCIRLIYNNKKTYDLSNFHPFFEKHSRINTSALTNSQTIDEYIQHLHGTKYYPVLNNVSNKSGVTTFDYEMALDVYYFTKSWKLKEKMLKGINKTSFTLILGTEIDMLNIMWIYRSKKSYDKSTAEIFTYLIPVNYKLTKLQLARLVSANTLDEYMNILSTTQYKDLVAHLKEGTIEREFNRRINRIYQNNVTRYPKSMTAVSYYLYCKDMEIDQLTTALECIRYGLDLNRKQEFILQ